MQAGRSAPRPGQVDGSVDVHLVDGTYELFRHFFAVPRRSSTDGAEVGALRGVLGSIVMLLEGGATHVAVATDHVVESFRNELWPGYKDGSAIDPDLFAQFHPTEEALGLLGVTVWPMVEFEADDAMAAGAAMAAVDDRVRRVLICTPDKDLGQCVGGKVVQWDRRADEIVDAVGIEAKFGVGPASIPDYLALVGDSADGFPGLRGWGAKTASTMLSHYGHIEHIPASHLDWAPRVRGAAGLAATLSAERDLALLFRRVATVRTDAPVSPAVDELEWRGPRRGFDDLCEQIGAAQLHERVMNLAAYRADTRQAHT
ncbi:5'-3' exonuclease [Candidatus Poriferisodalis sp.]|uniref:5'-3' exonuclease n=1 Tax=Candidatus Poriferisodalis sp. TaxID=3101277 RepID=UPI003B0162EB